jgi:hypothetical protein
MYKLNIPEESRLFTNSGVIAQASYSEQAIDSYRGNPFIEALPPILSPEESRDLLQHYPKFNPDDRELPGFLRYHKFLEAAELFVPLPDHIDIEQRFSRMIRAGYVGRNPVERGFWSDIDRKTEIIRSNVVIRSMGVLGKAWSLALLGISGVGKSTTVEKVLQLYAQGIIHSFYQGQVPPVQIVWLKLECPQDGSTRGLCLNFFQAVDDLLGTPYYRNYARNGKATKDEMMPWMARVAAIHGIGVLVIDEIQHLGQAGKGGADLMLNFFVNLINTIKIPVVLVGTYHAIGVLTTALRNIRRMSELGEKTFDRMEQGPVWDWFVERLWDYQYVQQPSQLTPVLKSTLYEVSQGITEYAVKIFFASQIRAIETERERITRSIIRSVALDSFRIAQPVLQALKISDREMLSRIADVHPPMSLTAFIQSTESVPIVVDQTRFYEGSKALVIGNEANESVSVNTQLIAASPSVSTTELSRRVSSPRKSSHRASRSTRENCLLQEIVANGEKRRISAYEAINEAGYVRPVNEFLEEKEIL